MFGFLTPAGTKAADPLADVAAVEAFWHMLPQDDPIAAQEAVCAVLADAVPRGRPNVDRLRALLELDQRARVIADALLVNYVTGNPPSPSLGTQSWQAPLELCRAFGRAHGRFLQSMRDSSVFKGWREYLSYMVLRLLQHRQIELLLRPFADERSTWFSWKELHEAYRFAQSRELLHDDLPINRSHSPNVVETTLEREYIHVLLQDLMNGGHFPPYEAFWVSQSIPRWSQAATLESRQVRTAEHRFVVDLDGDAGLARLNPQSAATCLCLDTATIQASIRDEIASLRDVPGHPSEGWSLTRGRQLKLLRKLDVLCAPERPVIARRGERKPVALPVEAVMGMPQILRTLRSEAEEEAVAAPRNVAMSDDITITGSGGFTEIPVAACLSGASTVTQGSTTAVTAVRSPLTMVDRSDSGCRLHGPTPVANPIAPGVLIAFREDGASTWTLAVVRRVKKRLAGKRVEIGVEYLGKNPRRIIVVAADADVSPAGPPGGEPPRFAALYLPESATHPVLPIKTLVLPARGLAPEARLSIRSRADKYTIQLKEPLEEQADFIWSPFEILDRWLKDEPVPAESTSAAR
jgi:hypothetical protein